MSYETLTIDVGDNHIATLTMRRPDQLNALNRQVLDDLVAAADELGDRHDIRVLVVTGAGRAFVAGADIKEMHQFGDDQAEAFVKRGHQAMDALSGLAFPVVAAVNGFALGGGLELALACDLIYASDQARFGLPEVGLGIIPGFGGTQRLGRTVGWHHARELVLSGRQIDAAEAHDIGLVCGVFPDDTFMDEVVDIGANLAAKAPLALRAAKRAMARGAHLPLDEANAVEREAFEGLFGSNDRREGMEAFMEKRTPEFDGT